jgi:hypothetical protein
MAEGDTLINAVIGGIASIVLSIIPLSPLMCGALAGYPEGGDRGIGVYAGVVAAIPFTLFLFLAVATFGILLAIPPSSGGGAFLVFIFLAAVVGIALYTVAFSAIGGWIGNYVKDDTDLGT